MHARFDAFKLAERGESLSGEVDASVLGRLADRVVAAPEGRSQALRWTVEGGRDEKGRPRLNLNLDGAVFVTCQRCLRPLEQVIAQDTDLLLARDEAALIALDAEESEVVLAKAPLDALSLVEDELLLSLPFAPRHAQGECVAADDAGIARCRDRPGTRIAVRVAGGDESGKASKQPASQVTQRPANDRRVRTRASGQGLSNGSTRLKRVIGKHCISRVN